MTKINFNQAKEFLEGINENDKVLVIHHDDLDGFASGILLYDWCKKKGAVVEQIESSYEKLEIDFEKFNKILIADIAPHGVNILELPKSKKIFYTDHHPKSEEINSEILEFRTSDEGYIPSSRTVGELTKIKPWLALAGTFADMGQLHEVNNEYIEKTLKEIHLSKEEMERISIILSNTLTYYFNNPKKAFEEIERVDSVEEVKNLEKYSREVEEEIARKISEVKKSIEKIENINFAIVEKDKYPIKKILITKISVENPDEMFIFLQEDENNPNFLGISSRYQNEKANLPELLSTTTNGLENANSGGHKRAAGGKILKKDLQKFKENLKKYVETQSP